MIRLLPLLLLLFATAASAEMRILDVAGDADAVTLMRYGRVIDLAPFAALRVGDEIHVSEPKVSVLVGGAGERVRIDQTSSPYRVAEIGQPTVLDNAIDALIGAYDSVTGAAGETITVITRGDPALAPAFLCLAPVENLVPEGVAIRVFWGNGQAPFSLTLNGSEGDGTAIEVRLAAAGSPALLGESPLTQGAYRVVIEDAAGVRGRYPARFQVVPGAALPEPARSILAGDLPSRAKHRLLAMALKDRQAWRYASVLFAAQAGDDALLSVFLARLCR